MKRRTFLQTGAAALTASMVTLPAAAQNSLGAIGYLRTNWSKDPFSLGSYSYIAKRARRSDHRKLAEAVDDKLFFAGEACHPKYNSTVHAAYESGLICADHVLDTDMGSIAIVGAGISGLAAAHRLASAGKSVTVFEARGRIGGRIWTSNELPAPLDLGASWIHGVDKNPLSRISDELGLERVATDDTYVIRGEGGVLLGDEAYPEWLQQVADIEHGFGTEFSTLNWNAYGSNDGYRGDEVIFPGGYADIFEALTGDYDLRLNQIVERIDMSEAGVSIGIKDHDLAFDGAIVTLPLGVLKAGRVQFSPPLPNKKRRAISRLGMGVLDKLYIHFETVFWDRDVTWLELPQTGLPRGQFNQWLNIYKYSGAPILMAFNGATPARDLAELTDSEVLKRGLSALHRAFPA